jgi:hypothetical protein
VTPQSKSGQAVLLYRFLDHTIRHTHTHTHTVELFSTSDQLVAEAATCTTQHTNIHALSGIRTHDAGNRGAINLRLRPHRDRLLE